MNLSSIYRKITPYKIRKALNIIFAYRINFQKRRKWQLFRKKILNYYADNSILKEQHVGIIEAVKYIKKTNTIFFYPYSFADGYLKKHFNIIWDDSYKMYYVIIEDQKKMYLNKTRDRFHHENYCKSIFMEQDIRSPHRYLTEEFDISPGATIIDAGGAEGLFTLMVIDKIQKAYIIEPDPGWFEALKATFEPWKGKVEIIPKFISNSITDHSITVDSLFENDDNISVLKADIEGFELKALQGAEKFLKSEKQKKLFMCTYHHEEDEKILTSYVSNYGFDYTFSAGYMIPLNEIPEKFKPPFFRKVLFRAKK